ncbi:MAG: hypothetical protein WD151_08500 [Phycisphaeraceae bacterium]
MRDYHLHKLINVFVMLEPSDHLPPRLPAVLTDELRATWFKYASLWADLRSPEGVEPNEDTLGDLWSLYLELRALGVEFDPIFAQQLDEVGTLAVNVDTDREPKDYHDGKAA